MTFLAAQELPGNIRQLRNVLASAILLCPGENLRLEEIRHALANRSDELPLIDQTKATESRYAAPNDPEEERRQLIAALQRAKGNKSKAARLLGMSRSTLYQKLDRHGIDDAGLPPGETA